jgi:hypothetical protein
MKLPMLEVHQDFVLHLAEAIPEDWDQVRVYYEVFLLRAAICSRPIRSTAGTKGAASRWICRERRSKT